MLRSAAKKVAWVGRSASMVFGLALVLALLFGAASMAVGATGGNFLLGKANSAGATTKLTSAAGTTLQLINNGTAAAATALNLTVPSGHPPLTVNSSTRVANLNADKVDGLEGASFMHGGGRASQGKVAIPAGSSATILQTQNPAVSVLYECPSDPPTRDGTLDIVEGGAQTESLNVLIDAKSFSGVQYSKLGPNDSHSIGLPLARGADHVTVQVQGTNVATIEVFTVHRPGGLVSAGDCHTQAQAIETR